MSQHKPILSVKERKVFEKAGKGYLFSAKIKHLDLQYNGEFETTFHYSEDMTLEECIKRVLNAVQNQLEIDSYDRGGEKGKIHYLKGYAMYHKKERVFNNKAIKEQTNNS